MIAKKIPVIFDGAFGTQIEKLGLDDTAFKGHAGCIEILNLTRPDIVENIHKEYLEAGAMVIETNTFGASRPKLTAKGLAGKVYEINKTGALLARQAVADRHCCVCGALGPTGFLPSSREKSLGSISFDALADIYEEQAEGLLDGGVDLLLLETAQDLLEVRAAIFGIRRLLKKRAAGTILQVQVTMDAAGRMLLGSDLHAFLGAVVPMGADVVGFNCGTGPGQMAPFIESLLASTSLPVAMQPNAGMPENAGGTSVYKMEPSVFAGIVAPLVTEKGLSVVGGCCGTTPDHIRELSRLLDGKKVAGRQEAGPAVFCATGISGVNLETVARPVIIGERLNTQGSKKTKELVLSRNWDGLAERALEQARLNSSLLDLCVAVNERDDEKASMKALVAFLSDRVGVPFSLDTMAPGVMEAALKACPGSAMLNSINLEKGGKRARDVLTLARDFGCPVIALTIDDEGMAKTVERKVALARQLHGLACVEFGLPENRLYIDPLVFTLATGDAETASAAAESLEALRQIKNKMPGVRTIMGVSNVSYGFSPPARRVLNNMMLSHAAQCGLDAAIFNPLHRDDVNTYDPVVRALGEALLFNRSPSALKDFIRYFDGKTAGGNDTAEKKTARKETLSPAERLRRAILDRDRRAVPTALPELLKQRSAAEVLDKVLLPAMAEVGERMAAGTMILPFVLQAAEVMREAVALLEPHLKGASVRSKGKIVLATVFGDVHDIGKNLVGSIMRNQGFEVVDLGRQIKIETIVKAVREHGPDAVGLSALLVSTSREMAECVREFARQEITVPVIIGGAAVNRGFASRIAELPDGTVYKGNVYYGKDAFEAAKAMERIRQGGTAAPARPRKAGRPSGVPVPEKLECVGTVHPPFYGTGAVLRWEREKLLDKIDSERLFKAWWGGGKLGSKEYEEAAKKEFAPVLKKLRAEIEGSSLLDPAGLYGFFPVITDNEQVILLDPSDFHTELGSFLFPRMPKKNNRSIADYLRPEGDLIAVQAVTAGGEISGRVRDYFSKDDRYSLGFFLNGIGGYLTESLADLVTTEITRGLGLPQDTGRRYSFGYPGMPHVEEQAKLFEIMAITERLGIKLTERFQMVPEHSTLGIYIHHPKAEYLT
ncbi:MAG: homocysteine S-methyltransferase family protein [Chitinispirillaceae bacterium]|nr:homocysteine S-methyltransferase family protein [Chitinispirillaceae bacterium]